MRDLPDIMRSDGVSLHKSGQDGYKALCPFHEERTPSLHVFWGNQGKWVFHCFGCGQSGDAADYLSISRSIPLKEALRIVKDDDYGKAKPVKKSMPKQTQRSEKIIDSLPPCAFRYNYFDADKVLKFVVQRYEKDGSKTFKQYTPRGEKWKIGLDATEERPIYNLEFMLDANPDKTVLVVEGEKCVHLVSDNFPKAVAVCWAGGANAVSKTDWRPIYGRKVMLCADPDIDGHLAMLEVAIALDGHCPSISLVLPPIAKSAKDIGDVAAESADILIKWLKDHKQLWNLSLRNKLDKFKEQAVIDRKKSAQKNMRKRRGENAVKENPHFEILGTQLGIVSVMTKTGNQLFSDAKIMSATGSFLMSLCDDWNWWKETFGNTPPEAICRYIIKYANEIGDDA